MPAPTTDLPYLTKDEVLNLIREECEKAGGQTAWAKKIGIMPNRVGFVVRGKVNPSDEMLKALKLRHQPCYFSTARAKKPKKTIE